MSELKIEEFNVKQVNEIYRAQRRINLATNQLNQFLRQSIDLGRYSFDEKAQEESEKTLKLLEDKAEQAGKDMRAIICKAIKSVPRNWLVSSAPDTIDWSNPESMDYLKVSKIQVILDMATGAIKEAQETEKN